MKIKESFDNVKNPEGMAQRVQNAVSKCISDIKILKSNRLKNVIISWKELSDENFKELIQNLWELKDGAKELINSSNFNISNNAKKVIAYYEQVRRILNKLTSEIKNYNRYSNLRNGYILKTPEEQFNLKIKASTVTEEVNYFPY